MHVTHRMHSAIYDDDVEIEVAPFRGPHQLRYVPGPNLIWAFGEKFRLLIDGAPQLPAPFADFVMLGENAIHGAYRAQIDALVEQAGVDFGWSAESATLFKPLFDDAIVKHNVAPGQLTLHADRGGPMKAK